MITNTLGTCDKSHSCNTKQLCKQIGKCVHSMIKQFMCQGEDDWFAIGVKRFTLKFLLPQEFHVGSLQQEKGKGIPSHGSHIINVIKYQMSNSQL